MKKEEKFETIVKFEKVIKKEMNLLEILNLKYDYSRGWIKKEYDKYDLKILFYISITKVQIVEKKSDNTILSMTTNSGLDNKNIVEIVEKTIEMLEK